MEEMVRYRMVFTGRVQGVGFRYKAQATANMYRLTGYVKNDYDGSVVMEIQGKTAEIYQFLQTLNHDRFIDIYDMTKEVLPVEDGERSFRITY